MSGDDLSIVLFLLGSGLAVGLTAITLMGWRHAVVIWLLCGLTALFVVAGAGWLWIKKFSPQPLIDLVGEISSHPMSYVVMAMLLALVLAIRKKPKMVVAAADQNRPAPLAATSRVNHAVLTKPKPKYALPKEANEIEITQVTNKELGAMCSDLSSALSQLLGRTMRDRSSERVAVFNQRYASAFFWLYGEARRREHRDSELDAYYERPETITDIGHLNHQLKALADRLPLYQDA